MKNINQPVNDDVKVYYKMQDGCLHGPIEADHLIWRSIGTGTITEYSTDGETWHKHTIKPEGKDYYVGHEALEHVVLPEMKKGGEWWKNIEAMDEWPEGDHWKTAMIKSDVYVWIQYDTPIRLKTSYIPEAYSNLDQAIECLENIVDIRLNNVDKDIVRILSRQTFIEEYCTIQVNPGRACGKTRWIIDNLIDCDSDIAIVHEKFMAKSISEKTKGRFVMAASSIVVTSPTPHGIKSIFVNDWSYMTDKMKSDIYKFASAYRGDIKEVRIYAIG